MSQWGALDAKYSTGAGANQRIDVPTCQQCLNGQCRRHPKQDHVEQRARRQDAVPVNLTAQDHSFVEVLERGAIRPRPPLSQEQPAQCCAQHSGQKAHRQRVEFGPFSCQNRGAIGSTRPWRGGL